MASEGTDPKYCVDFAQLVPQLRPLPDLADDPVPPFDGALERSIFVRRTPVVDPDATRAVYVHGMGGSSNNWIDLMYLLEPTFPGIALDLPGYGFSEPTPDNKYGVGRNAKAVVELIQAEGGKPVHLFGNSLGGVTAVAVAARHPELVKSLTLISPAMMTRSVMVKTHAPTALKLLGTPRKAAKMGPDAFAQAQARELMALCYADPKRLPKARQQDMVIEVKRRMALSYNADINAASARALFDAAAADKGRSIWRLARQIDAPTFAIYGTDDRLVPVELAPKAASSFRNSQVTVLPDCGHCAQMEHPRLTAQLFLQWLATTGAA
ncbi:MAG: alpha/beta hydrolase [Candidatus Nanopelagicales bacterium]